MRTHLLLVPVAAMALLVSGCASGSDSPEATPSTEAAATCADTSAGAASDAVTVTGDFGAEPAVEFSSPLDVEATQRTIAIDGDGADTAPGDMVGIEVSLYNSETGEQVQKSSYAGAPMQVEISDQKLIPALVRAIECVPAGSRVVSVSPASEAWQDQGTSDGAVGPGDGVVIVADVVSITPDAATGKPVDAPESLPEVTLDDSGAPTVAIPDEEPPADLHIATLKQGDGVEVEDGDTVTVQYQGVNWRTGKIFDQSWTRGAPSQFATNQVISGFTKALVGQKVGSQVIAVIPPDEGYGAAGSESAGIEGTDTLVFVVDILATSR